MREEPVWQKIETVGHFQLSLILLALWAVKPLVIVTHQRAKLTGPVLAPPAHPVLLFIINPPQKHHSTQNDSIKEQQHRQNSHRRKKTKRKF